MKNVELHIFPGIQHSYMMPMSTKAYDPKTREFSMKRAFAIMEGLRGGGTQIRKASKDSTESDGDRTIVDRPPHYAHRRRAAAARTWPLC
jgi:hypothetical protein